MIVDINVRGVKNTLTQKKIVGIDKEKKQTISKIEIPENKYFTLN